MTYVNSRMRAAAARVVAFESREHGATGSRAPAAFAICEKLRTQWVNLMGDFGFRTLLSRALAMVHRRVAWLGAVIVKPNGSLEWSGELESHVDAAAMAEGSVVLVAQLFGLLEGFIGETLALRLMQDVWPHLPLNDSDSDKGK